MPTLSGTVKDGAGNFAERVVRVYRRADGGFVGQTFSNATTGAWSITTATTAEHFALVHDSSSIDDQSFGSVVSLVHFDGSNGATTTTDVTGKTWTFSGNAQLSTTQPKFGATALFINGSSGTGYISSPSSSDFTFGTGDFTIEMWNYPTALSGGGAASIIDFRPSSTNGAYPDIGYDGTYVYYVNSTVVITGGSFPVNNWYHVALCRSGTSTRLFVNGTQTGSTWTDNTNYLSTQARIGVNAFNLVNNITGYIDDLRITKGVARYTSNFTAPAAPFADQLFTGGAENAAIFDRLVPA